MGGVYHVNDEDLRLDHGGFGSPAHDISGTPRACQSKAAEDTESEKATDCSVITHCVTGKEK